MFKQSPFFSHWCYAEQHRVWLWKGYFSGDALCMIHPPPGLTLTRTATATGHQCGSGGSATEKDTATRTPAPSAEPGQQQSTSRYTHWNKSPAGMPGQLPYGGLSFISGTQTALLRTRQSGCSSCCRQATAGLGTIPK